MARSEFRDLKGALSRALRTASAKGPAGALEPLWREAVGDALARHSRPLLLESGRLTVEVESALLESLESQKPLVCERLNARLGRGAVAQIIFQARR
jgi:hypothetical protein